MERNRILKLVLIGSDIGVLYTFSNRLKRVQNNTNVNKNSIQKSNENKKLDFIFKFQLNRLNINGCKYKKPENYIRIFYDRGDFGLMKKFISEMPIHKRERLIFYSLACDRQYLLRMVECYKEIGNFKKF